MARWLNEFARKCGRVLARAHATTGDATAIDALQNENDHAQLVTAIRDGTVESEPGW
jgi:hypothetical protein